MKERKPPFGKQNAEPDIEHEAIGPAQERRNVRKIRGVVYSDSPPSEQSREMVRQWATRKIERLEAELADLRASSVVVRELCETCEGKGGWGDGVWQPIEPCPDCVDGWRLAEGVYVEPYGSYVIPAHLIEGDTNG